MQNKRMTDRGFSLVEVMMAMIVLLLVFLALMQTALVSIDANTRNLLRDEAISIAEQKMNELRNTSFDDATLNDTGGAFVVFKNTDNDITRNFRNLSIAFTPTKQIDDLAGFVNNKQIDVRVTWSWKGENFTHEISTIRKSTD